MLEQVLRHLNNWFLVDIHEGTFTVENGSIMVDENEVKRWIARLETEESSWTNYEKLAALYIIRNEHGGEQLQAKTPPMLYSAEPAPAKKIKPSGSEFLKAVGNVAQDRAWEVMDELMDTLKIVNEKAYNSVLKKLT